MPKQVAIRQLGMIFLNRVSQELYHSDILEHLERTYRGFQLFQKGNRRFIFYNHTKPQQRLLVQDQ